MTINAIAAHEKAVLSVMKPMTKKIIPSMRAMFAEVRLFIFITDAFSFRVYFTDFTSAYGLGFSNKAEALPFNVNSKNDKR